MTMFFQRLRTNQPPTRNLPQLHSTAIVQLTAVRKVYAGLGGQQVALKQIDLTIHPGEFVTIVGKSGSGKSTLINMITGIDRPSSGAVLINRTPLHELSENELAQWRGANLGIIFQFFQLLPTLTVLENILLPMDFLPGYHAGRARERGLQLLALVEMEAHADKLPAALSGGQQQRVAIARALANDPPLLIADEPTGNLDSKTADHVFRLFETLAAQGKTIVMVTHDSDLALRAHRSITIADGEIVSDRLNSGMRNGLARGIVIDGVISTWA